MKKGKNQIGINWANKPNKFMCSQGRIQDFF